MGFISGGIIASIFVAYFILSTQNYFPNKDSLSITALMILAIIFGGAVSGMVVENSILKKIILENKHLAIFRYGSTAGCIIGSLFFSPIALFLSIVIGGSFGGSLGGIISNKIGIGKMGIPIGISLGVILVIIVVISIGSLIGTMVGCFIENLVKVVFRADKR